VIALSLKRPDEKFRAAMIACALVAVTISGWRARLGLEGLVDLLLPLLMGACFALACQADGRLHGKPVRYSVQWLMVIFWPIAAPAYVMWTRRWRGLVIIAIFLAAILGASILGALVAQAAV
jgi:hypothetical protein